MTTREIVPGVNRDGVLDGRVCAAAVQGVVRQLVETYASRGHHFHLAVVRVGDDPASAVYVASKGKMCATLGIHSSTHLLPAEVDEAEVLALLAALNDDPEVDGVLVQLPLPAHLNAATVSAAVDPGKDVDGFHPHNLGAMFSQSALLEPCTPAGIMVLLHAAGVELRARRAVVVGRSVIVGRPVAQLLTREDATVTLCHRHTRDLERYVRDAEVLVVAVGIPGFIPGAWIQTGSVVVDVGINRLETGRLVGDVDFVGARERAALVTPVPGGVGPMTIAMLMWNTVVAGAYRRDLPRPGVRCPLDLMAQPWTCPPSTH